MAKGHRSQIKKERNIATQEKRPHATRYAAAIIGKVLKSAMANAENNLGMDVDKLYVEEVSADQGPTMKRIQPRAQGRAYRILKRSCHISIILNER